MQPIESLSKKNIFFFMLSFIGLLVYFFFFQHASAKIIPYVISYSIIYFLITSYLLVSKKNAKHVQLFLVFSFNLSIILLNLVEFQLRNLFLFALLIMITSFYKSFMVAIVTLIISMFEIVLILFLYYPTSEYIQTVPSFNISALTIIFFSIIGVIQIIYITKAWRKMEKIATSKEKEILSREAYLRLFFQSAQDGIAVVDLNNRVIDMNPAFEKLYGWKREESIGQSISFVPPENAEEAYIRFQQLLEGKSYHLFETKDMKKDGTVFDAQLSLSPIYDANGELIATSVISRDISYKKETEKLIIQSEKLKLAGEIAAGVAHEIRNPMTVISGFIQIIEKDKDFPYQSYMEIIQSEIERINLIIGEFLVLSKPQAEELKPFLLDKVIENTFKLFQVELETHNITFTQCWTTTHTNIIGNQNQLKQVFINIIKNAIESIEEKGNKGTIHLIVAQQENSIVEISISDNGIGMAQEQLERIFEPFYTTKQKGTGLGMMITNKIIQEHDGSIDIISKRNEGTTLTIKLPIADFNNY